MENVTKTRAAKTTKKIKEEQAQKQGEEVLTQMLSLTTPAVKSLLTAALLQAATTFVEKYKPGDVVVDAMSKWMRQLKGWGASVTKRNKN